jgi:2-polyprenyl-6-methoxyphenol hydroxylase-like FAD-dependent oxidoreductase
VVERASGPDRGGAGLYLPGNAVRALRRVGLEHLDAEPIRAQRILDHRGRLLTAVDLPSFWAPCGPCVGLLREDLHRALAAGVTIGYGLEPVGLDAAPDAVTVRLSDGSRREVDLVVGADGIRSAVRRLLGDTRSPRRVGQLSWRFLVDLAGVDDWTVLLGRGTSFLLVPVGDGRVYCYADATNAAADQINDLFAGFADPVPAALDRLADPYVGWIEEAPPPRPAERVVLVGDAAHATAPNMAQGAAMAVEDGLVLAEMLTADQPVEQALAGYAQRRQARVAWVQEQTHRRDRTRSLPPVVRNLTLRLAAERIFKSNYTPLRDPP